MVVDYFVAGGGTLGSGIRQQVVASQISDQGGSSNSQAILEQKEVFGSALDNQTQEEAPLVQFAVVARFCWTSHIFLPERLVCHLARQSRNM